MHSDNTQASRKYSFRITSYRKNMFDLKFELIEPEDVPAVLGFMTDFFYRVRKLNCRLYVSVFFLPFNVA